MTATSGNSAGESIAISSNNTINITGGTVSGTSGTVTESWSLGIYASSSINITGGTVIGTGSTNAKNSYGLKGNSIRFSGDGTIVTAKGATTALNKKPTATDCTITPSGETWQSQNKEITWTRPGPSITISRQPSNATVTYGIISSSLSVAGTASNGNTVTYQWYKNTSNANTGGTAISGATNASVTIPTDLNASIYYYYCFLKATDCADVTSNAATVTVNKTTATSAMKTVSATVSKDGKTGATVSLPAIPASAAYGTPTGGGTITFSDMSMSGNTLIYTAPSSTAGQTGTITIDVTGVTNYENYTITVTITSTDKTPVVVSGVSVAGKTYNGVAAAKSGAPVATKDSNTVVTSDIDSWDYSYEGTSGTSYGPSDTAPTNVGTYKLTVTVNDTEYDGKQEITFTISKATITIKANDKSAYVSDTVPVLASADCTITGLATGENLKTAPTVAYANTPDMSKAGTVTINASGAAVPNGGN